MSGKKPFKPLAEDLDDLAERVAASKNIPTLTPPARAPEEGRGGAQARAQPLRTPIVQTQARTISPPTAPGRPKPVPSSAITEIRLRCPHHICDQLAYEQQRLRQEGHRVTLSYIILSALQKAGYHVEEGYLIEDGRRLR
jgi:hypothetical protein